MAEINDLNVTDASNTARFPENMAPSAVNDGSRAQEGLLARWHTTINGSVVTTGSANAYIYAAPQTISAYYDGMDITIDANFTNTGAATINVNSIGVKDIKKNVDAALASGDMKAGGKYRLIYDSTNFQLLSPPATALDTGGGLANIVEDTSPQLGGTLDSNSKQIRWAKGTDVASATNVVLGTDGNEFDITGTTTIATIATLAVGTVVFLHFDDVLTLTHNAADFVLPGGANITTAANDMAIFYEYATADWRCISYITADGLPVINSLPAPDFTSSEQTVTADTQLDVAHSIGAKPTMVQIRLVCKTTDLGYSAGDEVVWVGGAGTNVADQGAQIFVDATSVSFVQGASIPIVLTSTFNVGVITVGNWKWVVRAWT